MLDIPPLTKSIFRKLSDVNLPADDTYAYPSGSNFGAVDSFARIGGVLYGFQMTVSLEHPIKQRLLKEILGTLKPAKLCLAFVVPDDCFDAFTRQSYLSTKYTVSKRIDKDIQTKVEQWVLKLPVVSGQ